jgi:hypothetical protein
VHRLPLQLFAQVRFGEAVTAHNNFQVRATHNSPHRAHKHSNSPCAPTPHRLRTDSQSFPNALVTLLRCSTGESWNAIMREAANTEGCTHTVPFDPSVCGFSSSSPSASPSGAGAAGVGGDEYMCTPIDGCGTSAAFAYFGSFCLLVSFVFVNLFVAVILEAFADTPDSFAEGRDDDEGDIGGGGSGGGGGDGVNGGGELRAETIAAVQAQDKQEKPESVAEAELHAALTKDWMRYDPRLAFTVRRPLLLLLLATLPRPHGLGMRRTPDGVWPAAPDDGGDGGGRGQRTERGERGAGAGAREPGSFHRSGRRGADEEAAEVDPDGWRWPVGARARAEALLRGLQAGGKLPTSSATFLFEDIVMALGRVRRAASLEGEEAAAGGEDKGRAWEGGQDAQQEVGKGQSRVVL